MSKQNSLPKSKSSKSKIPRSKKDDYTSEIIKERQQFIKEKTGIKLEHLNHYSFDPNIVKGNIEHFSGVAQVPIGIAGPLLVNGEYARGEFYVPLATTEGTLVASYNRGMKIIYESGGVTTTISDDAMQRAPVFIFNNAREARDFGIWVQNNFQEIKKIAESTTRVGKLRDIEQYYSNKFVFLRFNFTTGDAAGQNMSTKATFVVAEWLKSKYPAANNYILDGNIATDKKASIINTLRTRGKRVTAEITIPDHLIREHLRQSPFRLQHGMQISNVGAFMTGAMSNANHTANGITALFIATGQDVANVAESSTAIMFAERTKEGDFYYSITIPSLIVATYGGGTGLATQKECLELMDCYGTGKVNKFAEIVAATAIAGEISLMSAIGAKEWVSSHEKMGRNR
ncbi:MAG: hydroxymethylglutaryl-CoA reductase [Candidatus Hodarchaeota archaeon]